MCGRTVTLHGYPDGTYDYYGYFIRCTAHNGPCQEIGIDGFVHTPNYLCDRCSGIIDDFMRDARAKITEQPIITD